MSKNANLCFWNGISNDVALIFKFKDICIRRTMCKFFEKCKLKTFGKDLKQKHLVYQCRCDNEAPQTGVFKND